MGPRQFTVDYYAVLEVIQTADQAAIKSSYKRLARLKHPDKNGNSRASTVEFQRLSEAYETLSDPNERRRFDLEYAFIKKTHSAGQEQKASSYSWNASGSGSSYARPTNNDPPPRTDDEQVYRRKIAELKAKIEQIQSQIHNLDVEQRNAAAEVLKKRAVLQKLQVEEEQDARADAARNTWFGYFFRPQLPAEEVEERQRRAAGRRTGRIVVESQLDASRATLDDVQSRISKLESLLVNKIREKDVMMEREESARLAAEARARAEEARRQAAEQLRKARQEAERQRKEEEARREAEVQRQAERRKREEEAWRADIQQRVERMKREEEASRAAEERLRQVERERQQRENLSRRNNTSETGSQQRQQGTDKKDRNKKKKNNNNSSQNNNKICKHRGWWEKVEGRNRCYKCLQMQGRFVFQCPGCQILTCGACLREVKTTSRLPS